MKLSEVFEHLQFGELSNLGIVDKTTGLIPETLYPKVLSSVNLGLADLHKRFVLKKGYLHIVLQPDQTMYPMKSQYQVGNKAPAGTVQFIKNEGVKFVDDLLKVEKVITEKGDALGLNDATSARSVATPQYNMLYVSSLLQRTLKPTVLTLEYRKGVQPLKICESSFDQLCVEVDLPDTHLMALLYFTASRLHNPIGFSQATTHEGNNYSAKYESECLSLDYLNLRVDEVVENGRARRNGWP
jgi:hypothetical protein